MVENDIRDLIRVRVPLKASPSSSAAAAAATATAIVSASVVVEVVVIIIRLLRRIVDKAICKNVEVRLKILFYFFYIHSR